MSNSVNVEAELFKEGLNDKDSSTLRCPEKLVLDFFVPLLVT